jgi:hypothetical protein
MFHADSAVLRVAQYVLAHTEVVSMRFEQRDAEAAVALDITVRTYRDALRKLARMNVIWRDELKTGPETEGENRVRVCLVNAPHPFWSLAMAADELAGWRR